MLQAETSRVQVPMMWTFLNWPHYGPAVDNLAAIY
jgi:hypothetical protein